jgi:hypothetical protein
MTFGVGNIVALICIVISIVFAIVMGQRPMLFGGRFWRSSQSFGGEHGRPGGARRPHAASFGTKKTSLVTWTAMRYCLPGGPRSAGTFED